jgi:hypothetical protein
MPPKPIPRLTGGNAVITEYSATSSRAVQVRKFEVYGPYVPQHYDIDLQSCSIFSHAALKNERSKHDARRR